MTALTNKSTARIITTPDSDLKVVNAARVSFAKENTEIDVEADGKLIRYLATHRHWTPFSHCRDTFFFFVPSEPLELEIFKFFMLGMTQDDMSSAVYKQKGKNLFVRHSLFGWSNILNKYCEQQKSVFFSNFALIYAVICNKYPLSAEHLFSKETHWRFGSIAHLASDVSTMTDIDVDDDYFIDHTICEYVPIFVARQRFKHMVGTTYNEVSRRYVSTTPEVYFPEVWRGKHENKKQGSTDDPSDYMHGDEGRLLQVAADLERMVNVYEDMIANGVCPEQARLYLPQGMMTEYYVTAHTAGWKRFINQRKDSHAQKEIRDLAVIASQLLNI